MNGSKEEAAQEVSKKSNYMAPPMTTKNKAVAARKAFNRNHSFIQLTLFHKNRKKLQSKYQLH